MNKTFNLFQKKEFKFELIEGVPFNSRRKECYDNALVDIQHITVIVDDKIDLHCFRLSYRNEKYLDPDLDDHIDNLKFVKSLKLPWEIKPGPIKEVAGLDVFYEKESIYSWNLDFEYLYEAEWNGKPYWVYDKFGKDYGGTGVEFYVCPAGYVFDNIHSYFHYCYTGDFIGKDFTIYTLETYNQERDEVDTFGFCITKGYDFAIALEGGFFDPNDIEAALRSIKNFEDDDEVWNVKPRYYYPAANQISEHLAHLKNDKNVVKYKRIGNSCSFNVELINGEILKYAALRGCEDIGLEGEFFFLKRLCLPYVPCIKQTEEFIASLARE